ncbi:MAG: DUF924 domain-containing protein [Rhodopila sp.]|nr:DUF924 domain-containing protein [Rhodopila sp.]
MATTEEVLHFWFLDSVRTDARLDAHMRRWFHRSMSFDRSVRRLHGDDIGKALRGQLDHWADSAHGRLALIILLDQMTRNAFRGTRDAYAGDPKAIELSLDGIRLGADLGLLAIERLFFYLPLFHSECTSDQQRSVACFENLAAQAPASQRGDFAVWAAHARQRRMLLQRFTRFPDRNRAMGRRSTPGEWAFLLRGGVRRYASAMRQIMRSRRGLRGDMD